MLTFRSPDMGVKPFYAHGFTCFVLAPDIAGARGIVTNEDLVETLLGMEIVDEVDSAVDMQALARERGGVAGPDGEE